MLSTLIPIYVQNVDSIAPLRRRGAAARGAAVPRHPRHPGHPGHPGQDMIDVEHGE
jgi:hypothetical protein